MIEGFCERQYGDGGQRAGETNLIRDGVRALVCADVVGGGGGVGCHVCRLGDVTRVAEFEGVLWHRLKIKSVCVCEGSCGGVLMFVRLGVRIGVI